jgi:hypothetical protein
MDTVLIESSGMTIREAIAWIDKGREITVNDPKHVITIPGFHYDGCSYN